MSYNSTVTKFSLLVWFGYIKTTDPLRFFLVCDAAARSGTAHHVGLCMALGYVRPQRLPGRGERHFQVLCWSALEQKHAVISNVADPDLGSGAFLTQGPKTHIFDSLIKIFLGKQYYNSWCFSYTKIVTSSKIKLFTVL